MRSACGGRSSPELAISAQLRTRGAWGAAGAAIVVCGRSEGGDVALCLPLYVVSIEWGVMRGSSSLHKSDNIRLYIACAGETYLLGSPSAFALSQ